jgi:hypothetical protein
MANLTIAQKTNFSGFPKAAELIEITGSHLLDAHDRAVQNLLFQHAHDSGQMTKPDAEWELTFAEVRKAISKHKGNEFVRASLRNLMRVQVVVHYLDARNLPRTMETNLLEFIDTDDGDGAGATIQFGIPKKLRAALARSNRWGRVKSEITYAMTSKYSISLYEMLCLRANMDRCIEAFPLDRFRDLLGVPPGTYDRPDNFKAKVITPALLEVNGLSDLGVKLELRRKNPRAPVHEVLMTWWKKEGDDYRAASQERNRSKLGRMARLTGKVETVTDL